MVDATVLIALALIASAFLKLAYARRYSIWGEILDRALNFFLIVSFLAMNIRHPLSLSFVEILGLAAPLALSIGARPFRAVLHFATLLFIVQLVLMPRFDLVPMQFAFWTHWITAVSFITAAIYDLLVNRYRPDWRDCVLACLVVTIYDAVILPVDLPVTVNHTLLIAGGFVLATFPWQLIRRDRVARPAPPPVDLQDDSELIYST